MLLMKQSSLLNRFQHDFEMRAVREIYALTMKYRIVACAFQRQGNAYRTMSSQPMRNTKEKEMGSKRRLLPKDCTKWCRLFQIFHKIFHIIQISPQQPLLLIRRPRSLFSFTLPPSSAPYLRRFTRTPPQPSSTTLLIPSRKRRLRHQIKVQKLHQLQLHLPTRTPILEQTRHRE